MLRRTNRCVAARVIVLALAGVAAFAAVGSIEAATKADEPRLISIHVGIPGFVYLGQPFKELTARFPKATVTPFAGQDDALVVAAPEEGLSCYVVGPSRDALKVASIGFNFDQTYLGAKEGAFRTREGIGKGSTINDLLGTYGRPAEIGGEHTTNPKMRRTPQKDDPDAPKNYYYVGTDGATKTYFVVQYDRVLRVVVYDIAPLERHLLKRPPEK